MFGRAGRSHIGSDEGWRSAGNAASMEGSQKMQHKHGCTSCSEVLVSEWETPPEVMEDESEKLMAVKPPEKALAPGRALTGRKQTRSMKEHQDSPVWEDEPVSCASCSSSCSSSSRTSITFLCLSVRRTQMDVGGGPGTHLSILPAAEIMATLKPEAERPRCASTPCSPIRGLVAGYQILHMDANYLVGFATGEELLKLAQRWPEGTSEQGPGSTPPPPKSVDSGAHRSSRVCRGKHRYYQPYDIPAGAGRRRRRMPSSSDTLGMGGEPDAGVHAPLPLCLLKGTRAQSKSLDYLNLDKMASSESPDTEVLQHQLQHLTLRSERVRSSQT